MSEEQGQGPEAGGGFEEQLRGLLAEDAYTIRPSPAPYPAIRRRGVVERRRRVAAAGAVLVTLAAVPVGAYAVGGSGGGSVTASPQSSVSASRAASPTPTPTPSATPSGPAGPATPGQLLDGITFAQAADGLDKCFAYALERERNGGTPLNLGSSDSYRILLAMNSTGDQNSPGDGVYVVAVREKPEETRIICSIKDGEASGLDVGGSDRLPGSPSVVADSNGGRLYRQSFIDKGNWKLPFRWGFIGTVEPSVAKVTVSYGDDTSEAVLDRDWFIASGVLNQQVTMAPHVKGYDAGGKLVYDSDEDATYQKTLW